MDGGNTRSALTAWVTFVPCLMFVLLGAPSVEKIRSNQSLTAALTGITAAVVGVIANLAFYFALHTFFTASTTLTRGLVQVGIPVPNSVSWSALMISGIAGVLLFVLRWPLLAVLGVCALLGVVVQFAPPAAL